MGLLSKVVGTLTGSKQAAGGYDQGANTIREYYEKARQDLTPYRQFGEEELGRFKDWWSTGAPTAESVTQTPGYQFRLGEGQRAVENSAISRGGLLSGNAIRAMTEYGQNYASNEYDKELSRYQNDFARRMSLLNMGQSAASGTAGLASSAGQGIAGMQVGRGQAEASGKQGLLNIGGYLLGKSKLFG